MTARKSLVWLAVGAVLWLGTLPLTYAAQPDSASGAGQIQSGGALRTFTFSAVTQSDGTVTGQAEIINRAANVKIHLAINCLEVTGNTAVVSGVVTQSNALDVDVGDIGVFAVRDNGAGSGAPRDEITSVEFNPASSGEDCTVGTTQPFVPIQAGNITVQPGS
jgi:hypothetical protein